jgi:hypothetical protein
LVSIFTTSQNQFDDFYKKKFTKNSSSYIDSPNAKIMFGGPHQQLDATTTGHCTPSTLCALLLPWYVRIHIHGHEIQ